MRALRRRGSRSSSEARAYRDLRAAGPRRRYDAGMTIPQPQPQPQPPAWSPPAPPASKRPVKVWDVVVTIILLVGAAVVAALASLMGMFLVMASDPCGARDCSTELITIGWLMGMILPWVVLVATAVVAIV